MIDIALHRRLMRKRILTFGKWLILNKKAARQYKKILGVDRGSIEDNSSSISESTSRWQRFCEAWARLGSR